MSLRRILRKAGRKIRTWFVVKTAEITDKDRHYHREKDHERERSRDKDTERSTNRNREKSKDRERDRGHRDLHRDKNRELSKKRERERVDMDNDDHRRSRNRGRGGESKNKKAITRRDLSFGQRISNGVRLSSGPANNSLESVSKMILRKPFDPTILHSKNESLNFRLKSTPSSPSRPLPCSPEGPQAVSYNPTSSGF